MMWQYSICVGLNKEACRLVDSFSPESLGVWRRTDGRIFRAVEQPCGFKLPIPREDSEVEVYALTFMMLCEVKGSLQEVTGCTWTSWEIYRKVMELRRRLEDLEMRGPCNSAKD